jgi:hypothetical protein
VPSDAPSATPHAAIYVASQSPGPEPNTGYFALVGGPGTSGLDGRNYVEVAPAEAGVVVTTAIGPVGGGWVHTYWLARVGDLPNSGRLGI